MYTLKKELSKFYSHYLILLFSLAIGIVAAYVFRHYPSLQFASILYMAGVYVVWGVIHHRIAGDFHLKILAEYLLFAAVTTLLLWVLIFKP